MQELNIKYMNIRDLKPYKKNAKKHNKEQVEQIANSIKEFGFNLNSDPLTYDCFKPFRLHAYLDGQLMVITKNDGIRYDEKAFLKEDVDFMLQHIEKYHKTLRIDKYYPKAKGFDNKGGFFDMRTEEKEKAGFRYMQKKWGSQIIRPNRPRAKNKSKIRSFGGAIKIKLPLKGC